MRAADLCKGCVCISCTLSEKQGNVYGCIERRCKACGQLKAYIKLMNCAKGIPVEESGEIFRL